MGGEDFSFMLEARPGAFIFIGNGDSAGVHHPKYDFNDDAIPWACPTGRAWSRRRCRRERADGDAPIYPCTRTAQYGFAYCALRHGHLDTSVFAVALRTASAQSAAFRGWTLR